MVRQFGFMGIAALGALALAAPAAHATIVSPLTVSNFGSGTGDFGTVSISISATGLATVTFDANNGFLFVDGGAADLNVNGTISNVSFVSATPALAANQSFSSTGSARRATSHSARTHGAIATGS